MRNRTMSVSQQALLDLGKGEHMSVQPRRFVVGFAFLAAVALVLSSPSYGKGVRSKTTATYYVSLGDSYAVGDQPNPKNPPSDAGPTSGFTGYVSKKENLTLVNFGCGRETTSQMLTYDGRCVIDPGLAQPGPAAATGVGPGVTMGGETQVKDAMLFIEAHPGRIRLITVSAGISDLSTCAGGADPTSCLAGVTSAMESNLRSIVAELRAAAGSSVPLIGIGYPDAFLGNWVYPSSGANQSLVSGWVSAFQNLVNPALVAAYTSAGANSAFVNVTSATDAYIPLSQTTMVKPYGTIPTAVAEICKTTYYCSQGNYRANSVGYDLIGSLIVKEYETLQPSL
jgi:hypothetical protein